MDGKRKTAYDILLQVEKQQSYSQLALKQGLDPQDPDAPFVRRLVYGVIEQKIWLDYHLNQLLRMGTKSSSPELLTLLRLGLYQLAFMQSVPAYAAVSETVDMAGRLCPGREGLVNAVLRNYRRRKKDLPLPSWDTDPLSHLSVRYSCDVEIIRHFTEEFGWEEAIEILRFASQAPPLFVRVNTGRIRLAEAEERLCQEGFTVARSDLSPRAFSLSGPAVSRTDLYRQGYISIQSEESCYVADIADPKPGDLVIDMCAAPGGKTGAMGETMRNKGKIIALDPYPHRTELIKKEGARLHLDILEVETKDASLYRKEWDATADLVLCDVPCSGLGVLRRKPELKYGMGNGQHEPLPLLQERILLTGSRYVKEGGRLIYSTCTLKREENEERIETFLQRNKTFTLRFSRLLTPFGDHKDGFYIAVMQRK